MKTLVKAGPFLALAAVLCLGHDGWSAESSGTQQVANASDGATSSAAGQKVISVRPSELNPAEKAAKEAKEAERAERKRKSDAEIAKLDVAADSTRAKLIREFERRKQEKEGQRSPAPRAAKPAK